MELGLESVTGSPFSLESAFERLKLRLLPICDGLCRFFFFARGLQHKTIRFELLVEGLLGHLL